MARTHGRIKVEVWDAGSEFRALPIDAQWAYVMLLSQPQINNCGVLPYVPRKWTKYGTDITDDRLTVALGWLETHDFIVVDEDTDEVLVRTFIKHDNIKAQPNLVKSAERQFRELESGRIRETLQREHPDLFGAAQIPGQAALNLSVQAENETPSESPSETPSERGPRPRARTRTAPAPTPAPTPHAQALREGSEDGSPHQEPGNGLPITNLDPAQELQITQLVAEVTGKDDGSEKVIRSFAERLPEGVIAKVRETARGKPAPYAVSALKDECRERRLL